MWIKGNTFVPRPVDIDETTVTGADDAGLYLFQGNPLRISYVFIALDQGDLDLKLKYKDINCELDNHAS